MGLSIASIIGGGGPASEQADSQKADIKRDIAGRLTGKDVVKKICYADYNKDGRREAFVLSGPEKEGKLTDSKYTLWFSYIQNGTVISKRIRKDVTLNSKMVKLESVTLFCAATYCPTSTPMDVYRVAGNESEIIFRGDMIQKTGGDSFISIHSTYDSMYDSASGIKMGHTWKPYYFYYRNGRIYEYKAKRISVKQFKKYKNAGKLLKKYKKKGKIKSILYRSNGLVHVNFKYKYKDGSIGYSNVTFSVSGNKLRHPAANEGSYRRALMNKDDIFLCREYF